MRGTWRLMLVAWFFSLGGCTVYHFANNLPDVNLPVEDAGFPDTSDAEDLGPDEGIDGGDFSDGAFLPDAFGSPDDLLDLDGGDVLGDATPGLDATAMCDMDAAMHATLHLVSPLSTARVTSQRPVLAWQPSSPGSMATVLVCHDRACTSIEQTINAMTGSQVIVPGVLSPGVHFWRVQETDSVLGCSLVSATWEFVVGSHNAATATTWGSFADFNGDGYADTVLPTQRSTGVAFEMYAGSASGLTDSGEGIRPPDPSATSQVLVNAGDLDGDGFADFLVSWQEAAPQATRLRMYPGAPLGLGASTLVSMGMTVNRASLLGALGALTASGYPAVLVQSLDPGGAGAVFSLNGGAGGLLPAASFFAPAAAVGAPTRGVGVGDINGDGLADAAVGLSGPPSVVVFQSGGVTPYALALPTGTASDPRAPLIAVGSDFDGDGYADLASGLPQDGTIYIYPGSAMGLPRAPAHLSLTVGSSTGLAALSGVGDVNGDGYDDLLVQMGSSGPVMLYFGRVSGLDATGISLSEMTGLASATFPPWMDPAAGDIDNDGYADVVLSGTSGQALVLAGWPGGLRLGQTLSP